MYSIKRFSGVMVLIFSALALNSCMLSMMSHGEHQAESSIVLKEIVNGAYKLTITIPVLKSESEEKISVALLKDGTAIDNAVMHYVISSDTAVSMKEHGHANHSDMQENAKQIHGEIKIKNGAAMVSFKPESAGSYTLSIHVQDSAEQTIAETEIPFSVAAKKSSGMMGMSSTYWYLGAIAMAGMMVVMFTIRGGIF